MILRTAGHRINGGLLVLGGLVELAGFFLDMWKHAQGISLDFYHDLVWYGFAFVIVGMVRLEAINRGAGKSQRTSTPAV